MPILPILRNIFEMRILNQRRGRGLRTPSWQTRKAIGTVTDDDEIVRNRLWGHTKFGQNSGFIADDLLATVELDNSFADHTLAEIFVRRADENLLNAIVLGCLVSGGSERIVGLKVDHWPHHDAHRLQRLFENRELGE